MTRTDKPQLEQGESYLILGSGLPAGLDHEVMPTIAKALGACYVSSSAAKTKAYTDGEDSFKGIMREAGSTVCQQALQSLLVEQSVVCDADFFYKKHRRRIMEVAKFGGAATVGIAVVTPPLAAKARVRRWIEEDMVGSPVEAWKGSYLRHVDAVQGELQHITPDEVDYWMTMDGTAAVDQTIELALAELAEFGIKPAS